MEAFSVEADVRGGPLAPSTARRLMYEELSGRVPAAVMPDVALLLTELVANGVRHGGADEDAELRVRLEAGRRCSWSRSPTPTTYPQMAVPPVCGRPTWSAAAGSALHIVEQVATRWGVRDQPRTAVWFELDCDAHGLL